MKITSSQGRRLASRRVRIGGILEFPSCISKFRSPAELFVHDDAILGEGDDFRLTIAVQIDGSDVSAAGQLRAAP